MESFFHAIRINELIELNENVILNFILHSGSRDALYIP